MIPDRSKRVPYQLFMLSLCVYVLGALAIESLVRLEPQTKLIFDYADWLVCAVFLTDFLVSLWLAPRKWQYLLTWGWIDFASSIPMVDALRWGRAARILRIFRVFRGIRSAKVLASFVLARRSESALLAVALLSILLVVVSSLAILQLENAANSNIQSAEDAIWWACTTITTVGYGDKFPVTTEGRALAVVLMIAGVGLFGTFTGSVASWFLSSEKQEERLNELESLRIELQEVRSLRENTKQSPK